MKFNKQIAIILILLSMLLSAIAVSIYFYKQNQKVIQSNNSLVIIYVANKNIKKDTLISNKHIKQTTIAKQYVLNIPMLKKEIIGKYAKESIFKNEAFLKEKLKLKLKEEKEEKKEKSIDFKYNSYNMAYSMFKNPNYMLEPNDIIKIVSVTNEKGISVQYVIKNIRVLGFVSDGMAIEKSIYKKKIKKVIKKKTIEQIVNVRASEIILDIKENDMLSLIEDWNKGSQLWMVKSKIKDKKSKKVLEKKPNIDKEKIVQKKSYKKRRNYPIKWYYPKKINQIKVATIEYTDDPTKKKTKSIKIKNDFYKECSKKDKLLLVTSKKVYLRKHPSIKSKINRKIYKNYIIPYNNISKINNNWYLLCDESYIQTKDVKIIKYNEYLKLKNKLN